MDPTLLTILLLLAFATAIALVQARRCDKCLKDFEHFPITLAEKGGDLCWGTVRVFATGLEIEYVEPVQAREGHFERSFIFYKDQYEAMDALYRYPGGMTPEQQQQRRHIIERTANPGFLRRLHRRIRNWISILRDALVQAAALVIGAAKTRRPGSTVLTTQETQLKTLSSEVIGHAGNAFDPLLEQHLFKQVVLEVTRNGRTRSYCGWLKDYTSQFVEVVDAQANPLGVRHPVQACAPGAEALEGLTVSIEAGRLHITNSSARVLYVQQVRAGEWQRSMGTVLPPDYTADLTLPPDTDPAPVRAFIGTVERVDMIVPRTHALVRHAAEGALLPADAPASVMVQATA